ncbi:MAG: glycosyltransferase [Deltaproteobacteria bacterium]|nr:glycosyltransferase [Deltaproteobacteria bacterium]
MPRILLVSAYLAPAQTVGGRRAERMATQLQARGWQVTVLTLRPEYTPPSDATLAQPQGVEVIRCHALMPLAWGRLLRDHLRAVRPKQAAAAGSAGPARRPRLQALRENLLFPDEFIGWLPLALAAVAGRRFDAVLATIPPLTTAVIAAQVAKRLGVPLVLDYRDPWADSQGHLGASPELVARQRRFEDGLLAKAALVVGVSPVLSDGLQRRTPAPVATIPNAVDVVAAELTPGAEASLAYTGTLAYGRSLDATLQALGRLASQGVSLRLDYAGHHGGTVRGDAERLGVAELVRDHGEVSKAAALALVGSARAGLVTVSPGWNYMYPGKIFDILNAGRPIVLVGPSDCAAAELVRRPNLGWAVPHDDEAALPRALTEVAAGRGFAPVDLAELSTQTTMDRLDQHLRQLLG